MRWCFSCFREFASRSSTTRRRLPPRLVRRHSRPGPYYLIPLIEWQRKIDTRTVTVAVEQQETITRDSVTVKVNAVLWFRVVDPAKAVLSVENYNMAIYQVALTGLRNIIGQHDLDEVLKERDKINGILKASLNELSSPWGTTVEIVEMKDVEIPPNMQRVMAMEAEAIREKRARIIKASAELEASEKLAQAAAAHDGHARLAGIAPHADGLRGRRGEQLHRRRHDSRRIPGAGPQISTNRSAIKQKAGSASGLTALARDYAR